MKHTRLLLPAVVLIASACQTMQPVKSPVAYLEQHNPTHVRIYSQSGLTVLEAPRLNSNNTISGFDLVEREEATVDVSRIQRMEVKQLNRQRTTIFVGAMTVLGAAGAYMMTKQEGGAPLICDNYDVANRCQPRNPSKPTVPLGIRLRF